MFAISAHRSSSLRMQRSPRSYRRSSLRVEELEGRTLLSAADLANVVAFPTGLVAAPSYSPNQSPTGYWPAQIRHAYGFDSPSLSVTGAGQTIAIVDAYDDPNIAGDLAQFDAQFGIAAPPSFVKVTPQGQPAADAGWATEMALDVEWAHAIAPRANIMLVEAKDSSLINLLGAVDYAAAHGAQVISMSWGTSEFYTETNYDWHFSHAGVTFVASSGDYGTPDWPAISPHVLAVGGTNLKVNANDTWNSETGWGNGYWSRWYGGSGGGISRFESKPSYQSSVTQSLFRRTSPDVSYVADPNTPVSIYDSYGYGGWVAVGGTSAGAPQWAALIALVNQSHGSALTGDTQVLPAIYQIYKSSSYAADFHDIVSGNNGYQAGPGYDLVTGVGSPRANNLVPDLAKVAGSKSASSISSAKQQGSALPSARQSIQQPSVFSPPAPAPVSSGSVPNPAGTVGNQPDLRMFVPTPTSVPLTPAAAGPVETRIESGNGEDVFLPEDQKPAPMSGPDAAVADSLAEAQPSARLNQACDACFAGWTADFIGRSSVASGIASESGERALELMTGSPWLAVLVSCYWSAHFKDSERRGRGHGKL